MTSVVRAPEAIQAIEAELMVRIDDAGVYDARRAARRQLLGLDPVPSPSPRALRLLRRMKLVPGDVIDAELGRRTRSIVESWEATR